jgi:H+-transporting ATPase
MSVHSLIDTAKPGSKPDAMEDLKSLALPAVGKKLGSSSDGLSRAEAEKRLTQYGPNEIDEKKTNELLNFLGYFWGPIPWTIEAAVLLSAVARQFVWGYALAWPLHRPRETARLSGSRSRQKRRCAGIRR